MDKGRGVCARAEISLEAADDTELKVILSIDVGEINTTLELQCLRQHWFTKDRRVSYRKRIRGWEVFSYSDPIRKAFREYGIISASSYEPISFPSLKFARQAVSDVSLEAGFNIASKLTRQRYVAYKIGDLPLNIRREQDYWRVVALSSALPLSLKKHFNSTQGFRAAWESTDIGFAHYPSRKAAHQAVTNWLSQTITKGN